MQMQENNGGVEIMTSHKYFRHLEKLNQAIIFLAKIDSVTCDIEEQEKSESCNESSSFKNVE